MSRIGKNPVTIPQGVEVTLSGRALSVKGKNGQLEWTVPHEISAEMGEDGLVFTPSRSDKRVVSLWGMSRARAANMVKGVSEGFEKRLKVIGVGYRAAVQGNKLDLSLGYSHPVQMEIPQDIKVQVNDTTEIVVSGIDKQRVGQVADKDKIGQFAANIRGKRAPEPYKGKGVRYLNEQISLKEGKKK